VVCSAVAIVLVLHDPFSFSHGDPFRQRGRFLVLRDDAVVSHHCLDDHLAYQRILLLKVTNYLFSFGIQVIIVLAVVRKVVLLVDLDLDRVVVAAAVVVVVAYVMVHYPLRMQHYYSCYYFSYDCTVPKRKDEIELSQMVHGIDVKKNHENNEEEEEARMDLQVQVDDTVAVVVVVVDGTNVVVVLLVMVGTVA